MAACGGLPPAAGKGGLVSLLFGLASGGWVLHGSGVLRGS